ncbi:MAG: response regulator, partial [Deltaproteobacteria bacterium]|nr:response regulator [Deltaproteobacteria bacterium]
AERKKAEEALLESEEKYRLLTELLPIAIFELDNQANITFANKSALQSTGFTQKDIDGGLNMLQVIAPQDHDRALRMSQQVMQGIFSDGSEYNIQRKDGSTYPSFINTRPSRGTTSGITGYLFDLTRIKEAEKALQESEAKLARSKKMESLGLLAGGVAHDLNNVLSGIVSYPELLLLDLPGDSKLRKPIETMQESGHRAAAIVQDLLTLARGVATTKEPLNLNDIVSDYLYSPEFKKLEQSHPTVMVKTNLDTDLFNISGSLVHIRKVVMNLVSNASEAIEGSGNVSISTLNSYVDRPLKGYDDVKIGEYVVLSISDDGSGILQDDLERIFEPFYTKKVMGRSGTGLGLAIIWNVMQDHEGYINVTSSENGTSFELYFPITRDEVLDRDLDIPIEDFKGDSETILVVDDMESQRDISCKMLETLGYKTKAVSSGEEAVEYLRKHSVDLILLDMIMDPGINGRETYERIVKINPNQKAIIVSGFAETDDVKKTQKLGAGKYLKKPVTLQKIGLAIREELRK